MRLKKVGIVSAGVTAALLTASPLAFAGDYPTGSKSGSGPEVEGASTSPGKGGPGTPGQPGHPGRPGNPGVDVSKTCAFAGGSGEAGSLISGNALLANVVAQVPVAGNNIANLANCSDFLNHNLNNNLSNNSIAIGDGLF